MVAGWSLHGREMVAALTGIRPVILPFQFSLIDKICPISAKMQKNLIFSP